MSRPMRSPSPSPPNLWTRSEARFSKNSGLPRLATFELTRYGVSCTMQMP